MNAPVQIGEGGCGVVCMAEQFEPVRRRAARKVIHFGIAKATADQHLTDKTLLKALDQFIGTPAYISPEQAEMRRRRKRSSSGHEHGASWTAETTRRKVPK